jgi:hypothetical protein
MAKGYRRTPKDYDGTQNTTHSVRGLLPFVLDKIGEAYKDRPDLILAAWPDIIGPRLAGMTQALSFEEGVLVVKVKNSTLYSLLSQKDKPSILYNLRLKFPKVPIKNVLFRIG